MERERDTHKGEISILDSHASTLFMRSSRETHEKAFKQPYFPAVLPFAYPLPASHRRRCFAGTTSPNAAARAARDPWLDGGRVDIPGHWDAELAA